MARITQRFIKDPHANLDYGFDWTDYLVTGETISDSVWTVETGLDGDSEQRADKTTKIWISGGTVGEMYVVANKITTSAGRIDERSITITVENR